MSELLSLKLNIGCGHKRMPGYIHIDKEAKWKPDMVMDVTNGLPFADGSVDEIYSCYFIEHISDLVSFMEECYRVLKPMGKFNCIYPLYPDKRVFSSPYHERVLTEDTFKFFTPGYDSNENAKQENLFKMLKEDKIQYRGELADYHVELQPIKNSGYTEGNTELINIKLNIGCGTRKLPDYINIDNRVEHNPEMVMDIENGLPFGDGTVDEILATHFIEHVSDLVGVMKEFHRVLKPNGILTLVYPAYPDARVFSSPYHKQFLAPDSFKWFTKGQDPHEHPDFYFSIEEEKNLGQGDTIEQRVIMRPVK